MSWGLGNEITTYQEDISLPAADPTRQTAAHRETYTESQLCNRDMAEQQRNSVERYKPMPAAGAESSRVRRTAQLKLPSCHDGMDTKTVFVSELRDGRSVVTKLTSPTSAADRKLAAAQKKASVALKTTAPTQHEILRTRRRRKKKQISKGQNQKAKHRNAVPRVEQVEDQRNLDHMVPATRTEMMTQTSAQTSTDSSSSSDGETELRRCATASIGLYEVEHSLWQLRDRLQTTVSNLEGYSSVYSSTAYKVGGTEDLPPMHSPPSPVRPEDAPKPTTSANMITDSMLAQVARIRAVLDIDSSVSTVVSKFYTGTTQPCPTPTTANPPGQQLLANTPTTRESQGSLTIAQPRHSVLGHGGAYGVNGSEGEVPGARTPLVAAAQGRTMPIFAPGRSSFESPVLRSASNDPSARPFLSPQSAKLMESVANRLEMIHQQCRRGRLHSEPSKDQSYAAGRQICEQPNDDVMQRGTWWEQRAAAIAREVVSQHYESAEKRKKLPPQLSPKPTSPISAPMPPRPPPPLWPSQPEQNSLSPHTSAESSRCAFSTDNKRVKQAPLSSPPMESKLTQTNGLEPHEDNQKGNWGEAGRASGTTKNSKLVQTVGPDTKASTALVSVRNDWAVQGNGNRPVEVVGHSEDSEKNSAVAFSKQLQNGSVLTSSTHSTRTDTKTSSISSNGSTRAAVAAAATLEASFAAALRQVGSAGAAERQFAGGIAEAKRHLIERSRAQSKHSRGGDGVGVMRVNNPTTASEDDPALDVAAMQDQSADAALATTAASAQPVAQSASPTAIEGQSDGQSAIESGSPELGTAAQSVGAASMLAALQSAAQSEATAPAVAASVAATATAAVEPVEIATAPPTLALASDAALIQAGDQALAQNSIPNNAAMASLSPVSVSSSPVASPPASSTSSATPSAPLESLKADEVLPAVDSHSPSGAVSVGSWEDYEIWDDDDLLSRNSSIEEHPAGAHSSDFIANAKVMQQHEGKVGERTYDDGHKNSFDNKFLGQTSSRGANEEKLLQIHRASTKRNSTTATQSLGNGAGMLRAEPASVDRISGLIMGKFDHAVGRDDWGDLGIIFEYEPWQVVRRLRPGSAASKIDGLGPGCRLVRINDGAVDKMIFTDAVIRDHRHVNHKLVASTPFVLVSKFYIDYSHAESCGALADSIVAKQAGGSMLSAEANGWAVTAASDTTFTDE